MGPLLAVAALLLSAAPPSAGAAPPAAAKPDGRAAFEALKKLEGNWKTDGKDPKDLTFLQLRVVSNGTAVLETMTGGDKTKILATSVYSLDGGELVMTHYSGQANQPHMRLKAIEGKDLKFETTTVTNLFSPQAAHMNAVAFLVKDGDHLTQEWESLTAGKSAKTAYAFQREYVDTLK
jgi:hypothetical protein